MEKNYSLRIAAAVMGLWVLGHAGFFINDFNSRLDKPAVTSGEAKSSEDVAEPVKSLLAQTDNIVGLYDDSEVNGMWQKSRVDFPESGRAVGVFYSSLEIEFVSKKAAEQGGKAIERYFKSEGAKEPKDRIFSIGEDSDKLAWTYTDPDEYNRVFFIGATRELPVKGLPYLGSDVYPLDLMFNRIGMQEKSPNDEMPARLRKSCDAIPGPLGGHWRDEFGCPRAE